MSSSSVWRSRTRWRQTSMASPSTPGAASHGRIQATRAAISRAACWPGSSMMISTMPRTSVTGVSRCPRPLNLKSLLFAVTSGWSCCRRLQPRSTFLSRVQSFSAFSAALLSLPQPSSAFRRLTQPYSALFGLTQPFSALLGLSQPYLAFLSLSQPCSAFLSLTQPF